MKLEHVAKEFKTGARTTRVLRDVNLSIREGEFVAIIGPSGAGKSTTLNILGMLEQPTKGAYFFNGKNIAGLRDDAYAKLRNKEIGFMFQTGNLVDRFSIQSNLELPLLYAGVAKKDRQIAINVALRRVGLHHLNATKINELSNEEQQRLALARALVTRPKVLLADEPTGSLDQRTGNDVLDVLMRLHQEGLTIVLITHDFYIARHASRTVEILDGKMQDLA